MRIVFFGIYDYGVQAGRALSAGSQEVVGVVTKPDNGGERQPVADWATAQGVPCRQPDRLTDLSFLQWLRALTPDLLVVAGYHRRIPAVVLDMARRGAVNTHASLLPAYRGPCAHKWVIIKGETRTGITIHEMTPEFDEGRILAQRAIDIDPDDTGETLFRRMTPVAAALVADTVEGLDKGIIYPRPQPTDGASYFSYPTLSDAAIDWTTDAGTIVNLVRGVTPRPGAWCTIGRQELTIRSARDSGFRSTAEAGTVVAVDADAIRVATGTNDLLVGDISPRVNPDAAPAAPPGAFRIIPGDVLLGDPGNAAGHG